MRRELIASLSLALLVGSVAGCSPNYPEGRFACSLDRDCPPGLACAAGRCFRSPPDTGPAIDAGADASAMQDAFTPHDDTGIDAGLDAGTDAANLDTGVNADVGPDANVDGGPMCGAYGCVIVRFTNAWAGMDAPAFTIGGTTFAPLPYGETTPDTYIPLALGNIVHIDVPSIAYSTDVMGFTGAGGNYVIVMSEPQGSEPFHLDLLPSNFATRMGFTTARFVSVVHGGGTYTERRGSTGGMTLDLTGSAAENIDATPARAGAIQLLAGDASSANQLLAAFPGTGAGNLPQIAPSGGSYWVIFAGNPGRHLGARDGLRMIPAIPGAHAISSGPLLWVLNETDQGIDLCVNNAGVWSPVHMATVATINPGGLASETYLAFGDDGSPLNLALYAFMGTQCASGAPNAPVSLPSVTGAHRFLAAALYPTSAWVVHTLAEPDDPATASPPNPLQRITLANYQGGGDTLTFGRWTGSTFMRFPTGATVTSFGTGEVDLSGRISSIAVGESRLPTVTHEFQWNDPLAIPSTTPVAFAIFGLDLTSHPFLDEVFAPYGGTWTATTGALTEH